MRDTAPHPAHLCPCNKMGEIEEGCPMSSSDPCVQDTGYACQQHMCEYSTYPKWQVTFKKIQLVFKDKGMMAGALVKKAEGKKSVSRLGRAKSGV